MLPNSYTSNFRSKRYLVAVAIALLASIGTLSGISVLGISKGLIDHPYHANYRFQLTKIESSAPVETLLVGDSSLGAMLDTDAWMQKTQRTALHLALTGSDGYAGSLNMARRGIRRLHPRNLVIVHTLDMMTRDVAFLAFLQSNPDSRHERIVPVYSRTVERALLYMSRDYVVGTLRGLARHMLRVPAQHVGKEYIRLPAVTGAPKDTHAKSPAPLLPHQINPDKAFFLKQLGEMCRTEGLNCIYAHGPLYDEICRKSQDYVDAVQPHIERAGLKLAKETPLCITREELGDSVDHVRQDRKAYYTLRYLKLLGPYLVSQDR